MRTHLSLNAAYGFDSTLFDGIVVPNGVDSDQVVQQMLIRHGSQSLYLYDLAMTKATINSICAASLPSWQRMYDALTAEYSPIENSDRKEDFLSVEVGYSTSAVSGEASGTQKQAAYNTATMKESAADNQQSASGADGHNYVGHRDYRHAHGNIGVTSNQSMINQELALRQSANIYHIIADEICENICIGIY